MIKKLDKEIISEVLINNYAYKKIWDLCDYGTRFPGSEGERQAREYIIAELKSYGLKPEKEKFEHLGWKRGWAKLKSTKPYEREFHTISLCGGPSTPKGGIKGKIVSVGHGTPSEFEAKKDAIRENIVLSSSRAPIGQCNPPRQCHRRTKYGRAVEFGARAFIFMNSQKGMLPQTGSLRQNMEGEIPAVTVPFEEGEVLKRFNKMGDLNIELEVSNESFKNQTSNIVTELKGKNEDEIILIGAHYDCHDDSPGAMDNGTGVTTLLELARILSQSGVEFEKTIRFVFFAVEEMATVGSSFYVLNHRKELENIDLMINLDGPGSPGGKTFEVGGFDDLGKYILGIADEIEYPMKLNKPAFGADYLPFVLSGVPSAFMRKSESPGLFSYHGALNLEDRGWGHTPADTPDKILPACVNEGTIITGRYLIRAAMHKGPIAKHRSSDEVQEILEYYGMDEVLRYMKYPTIPIFPW
jgi:Zn-dependent M28 family amino/carboxypeptidase